MTAYPYASGTNVHEGMFYAYVQVQSAVLNKVKQLLNDHVGAEVLVTGHSLGGGLATLAALDIAAFIPAHEDLSLYTFGQPRIGDEGLSRYLFEMIPNYERVVHYDDAIPHNPLNSMGYKHAGNEVWYGTQEHTDNYKECENFPGQTENPGCSGTLWTQMGVTAHLNYLGYNVSG